MELSLLPSNTTYKIDSSLNLSFYKFLSILGLINISTDLSHSSNLYKSPSTQNKSHNYTFTKNKSHKYTSTKNNPSTYIKITNLPQLFTNQISSKNKYIILETNFKLYAYTTSEYEILTLTLFTEILLTLPNLIKATITEESLTKAFSKGITASQIITYLTNYSMFDNIPTTISNQITIWEQKLNRIQINTGYLYSNFLNLVDYQNVVKYSNKIGVLIDKDDFRRMVVIKCDGNDKVKEFVKVTMRK